MTPDLQQARDAAAQLAYPDEGYRWEQKEPSRPRKAYTPKKAHGGQPTAPWRQWTLQDSVEAIAELDKPKPTPQPKRPRKTCLHCGKPFWTKRTAKYCSIACSAQAARVHRVWLTCQHCGNDFQMKRADRRGQRFCSLSCANHGLNLKRHLRNQ